MNKYLIFDDDCGFCNKSILFFAKSDAKNEFLFISNKSTLGIEILKKFKVPLISDSSIILIINDRYYLKSKAIFKYLEDIKYNVFLNSFLKFIPIFISDFIYEIIAKNRKKIIKSNICEVPNIEISKKIINK